jgi:hypothetical protein
MDQANVLLEKVYANPGVPIAIFLFLVFFILFVYVSLSDRSDTITDFTVGSDKIVLTQLLNSLNYTGSNPIADGYITFTARGSSTALNIDTDGFGTAASPLPLALINNVAVAALNNLANFLF